MNYLLHYSGDFPIYGQTCIDTIRNIDSDCKIVFCGNNEIDGVNSVSLNDLNSEIISEIITIDYYREKESNLWQDSLLRIFYIFSLAKYLKLNDFVHFDLDVLIFRPFSEIQHLFKKNKFNITPGNESNLIFGYSYVNNLKILEEICIEIFEVVKNNKFYESHFYNKQNLNEMEILAIVFHKRPELFNLLQTTINKSKFVFDANSYGQYLGGLPDKRFSKGYINSAHYSGREMIELGIRPKLNKYDPQISYKGHINKIVNLHIHSKKLNIFSPKNVY